MRIRAVIFDIYKTLLEVNSPPADAAEQWQRLCREALKSPPRFGLEQFQEACALVIEADHAAARALGVAWPEVFWPHVMVEAMPELGGLPEPALNAFMLRHAALTHTLRLMPGALEVLLRLRDLNIPLGLVSNSQPYTLPELQHHLSHGLSLEIFRPALRFLSFEHGFSKPDPHVFRLLAARLRMLDITPAECLLVGDRPDNDIEPARAHGFQTWQVSYERLKDGGTLFELSTKIPSTKQ